MRSAGKFRELMKKTQTVVIPGAYDCITAKMVERTGFDAVYITGSGVSLSLLGQPDVNTVTYTELRNTVFNIRNTVDIPMLVDIDAGFGAPLNTIRLIRDFEQMDIAAVQIEDQQAPKKCGHELGRKVVSIDEMKNRIRSIYENRMENGIVIVARTDARTTNGLEDAIERGNAYLDAGADVVFVESPESYEEVKEVASRIRGPVLFNNVEGGRSPSLSRQQLIEAGVQFTIYPNAQTRVVTKKCMEMLQSLKETGTTGGMLDQMLDHKELWAMFDHEKWVELEGRYMTEKAEAAL